MLRHGPMNRGKSSRIYTCKSRNILTRIHSCVDTSRQILTAPFVDRVEEYDIRFTKHSRVEAKPTKCSRSEISARYLDCGSRLSSGAWSRLSLGNIWHHRHDGISQDDSTFHGGTIPVEIEPQRLPTIESFDDIKSTYEAVPTLVCHNFSRKSLLPIPLSGPENILGNLRWWCSQTLASMLVSSKSRTQLSLVGSRSVWRSAEGSQSQTDDPQGQNTHVYGIVLATVTARVWVVSCNIQSSASYAIILDR